jgi:hypothetical protein
VIIGSDAISVTARALARLNGRQAPNALDLERANAAVLAMAPVIIAQERERIAGLIDPRKLELLASWMDLRHPECSDEVQRDLRQWAAVLRGGEPGPASVADVLLDAVFATGAVSEAVIQEMKAGQ